MGVIPKQKAVSIMSLNSFEIIARRTERNRFKLGAHQVVPYCVARNEYCLLDPGGMGHSVTPPTPSLMLLLSCRMPCQWTSVLSIAPSLATQLKDYMLRQSPYPFATRLLTIVTLILSPQSRSTVSTVDRLEDSRISPAVIVGPGLFRLVVVHGVG
jgi:hypothetical protein